LSLEPEVLGWIVDRGRLDRLAYLSCSAGTLAKNLAVLTEHGYRVAQLIPFDFFPRAIHVECLALLRRGD
jgi:SAM-dependent methyltransferases related to tRNA (uracil-5-)-methyltransferase